MASPQFGRIVQVEILDPRGRNPKVRPAVIVTPDESISLDGEVDVVAITTYEIVYRDGSTLLLSKHEMGGLDEFLITLADQIKQQG